jgi:ABC-type transporter Mla subunit MlaD
MAGDREATQVGPVVEDRLRRIQEVAQAQWAATRAAVEALEDRPEGAPAGHAPGVAALRAAVAALRAEVRQLRAVLKTVARWLGLVARRAELVARLADDAAEAGRRRDDGELGRLTRREREVAALVAAA